MTVARHKSIRAPWFVSQFEEGDGSYSDPSLRLATYVKDSIPYPASQSQIPPAPSSPSGRVSPAVLFIIVILAVVFFISGLLHLIVRLLIKKPPAAAQADRQNGARISGSDALQRQLQQLLHLHDSGLDQAFIDALPLFLYAEIVGSMEPFDCAVCLCEFAKEDKLRLLPLCGHAFHVDCIDTWLLSNSTCPLCRGALFVQDLTAENPIFDFEDIREEERLRAETGLDDDAAAPGEKRVFPVRLGKFKKMDVIHGTGEGNNNASGAVMREEGESSSSSLDARRCFSMGSYQYVVVNTNLQVALSSFSTRNGAEKSSRLKEVNGHSTNGEEAMEGKRLGPASRRESFSMSKVWQWSNMKGKLPISSDTSLYGGLQI